MTTGPGFDPPRPEPPEWTREHPLGEHESEATPPMTSVEADPETDPEVEDPGADEAEDERADRHSAEKRPDSEGQRPYGGRPSPDPEAEHLPGEWHDEGLTDA